MSPNPYEAPRASSAPQDSNRDPTRALVLAVASLLFCAPVLAPIAIVKAYRTIGAKSSWQAMLALVLASLGLATSALFWFLALWQYLAPGNPPPR